MKGAIFMLLWFTVILLVGSLVVGLCCYYEFPQRIIWSFKNHDTDKRFKGSYCNEFPFACGTIMVCAGIALLIMIPVAIGAHAAVDGDLKEFNNYRTAIVLKLESGLYADEFGIYDKEIVNEIRYYNECVINKQRYIDNFWIGVFKPNKYAELTLIDYEIATSANRLIGKNN